MGAVEMAEAAMLLGLLKITGKVVGKRRKSLITMTSVAFLFSNHAIHS